MRRGENTDTTGPAYYCGNWFLTRAGSAAQPGSPQPDDQVQPEQLITQVRGIVGVAELVGAAGVGGCHCVTSNRKVRRKTRPTSIRTS